MRQHRKEGLEGIVGKKRDSAYTGERTGLWLKFKIVNELDAVVCGWTAPRKSREFFGALVLGLYDAGQMEFIGSVGTGLDRAKQKRATYEQLKKLRQTKSVFGVAPKLKETIEWVEPRIIARVKYGNWTDGKRLRAPVFLALRTDVAPEQCTVQSAGLNGTAEKEQELAETQDSGLVVLLTQNAKNSGDAC